MSPESALAVEVGLLLLSGVCVYGAPHYRFCRLAAPVLIGAFLLTFGAKKLWFSPVIYPVDGALRGVYLGVLALHALAVPASLVCFVASYRRSQLRRVASWLWFVAVLFGVIAYGLLTNALPAASAPTPNL